MTYNNNASIIRYSSTFVSFSPSLVSQSLCLNLLRIKLKRVKTKLQFHRATMWKTSTWGRGQQTLSAKGQTASTFNSGALWCLSELQQSFKVHDAKHRAKRRKVQSQFSSGTMAPSSQKLIELTGWRAGRDLGDVTLLISLTWLMFLEHATQQPVLGHRTRKLAKGLSSWPARLVHLAHSVNGAYHISRLTGKRTTRLYQ